MQLTGDRWRELVAVNEAVNADTAYRSDADLYDRSEFWEIAAGEGDCEDYALAKRQRLRALGWPEESLRIAVCTYKGQGHAVLTVDTDAGTWVLDNRYPTPQAWGVLPYAWIKRQAKDGPGWVEIA